MSAQWITDLKDKVLNNYAVTYEEAEALLALNSNTDLEVLYNGANEIRDHFLGRAFDLCSIMNVKSGKCSENCRFCAQSAHFDVAVDVYDLLDEESVVARAKEMEAEGVHRFSLVSSGKGIDDVDLEQLIQIYQRIHKETKLKICASHGIIDSDKALRLKEAGVVRYHHNVETSRAYYEKICTTHSFDERIQTIKACQDAGMEVCSGGIIGMGESPKDRLEMAFELRKMDVSSIPINILNPVEGTPMENAVVLSEEDILKTVAVFRFVNPRIHIRYAGGRNMLGDAFTKGYHAGINGALTGNLLTTTGKNIAEDKAIVLENGFVIEGL